MKIAERDEKKVMETLKQKGYDVRPVFVRSLGDHLIVNDRVRAWVDGLGNCRIQYGKRRMSLDSYEKLVKIIDFLSLEYDCATCSYGHFRNVDACKYCMHFLDGKKLRKPTHWETKRFGTEYYTHERKIA